MNVKFAFYCLKGIKSSKMSNNQLNNVCLSKASDQLTKLYPSNNDNTRNDSSLHNLTPSALDNWMPSNIEHKS